MATLVRGSPLPLGRTYAACAFSTNFTTTISLVPARRFVAIWIPLPLCGIGISDGGFGDSALPHFHQPIPSLPMLAQMLHDAFAILCRDFRIFLFDDAIGFGLGQLEEFAVADQVSHP